MPGFTAPDGTALHYDDEGPKDGLPLLALSGLTRSGRDFDFLAPHLPQGIRLIRMDYRGRGRSGWAAPESYAVPVEARDALALLDHLGIDRAALLGTSRGGIIAMMLAATAKDRLRGICLNDIGPELAPAGLGAIRDYLGTPPKHRTLAEAAAARPAEMPQFRDVPASRWAEEAERLWAETPDGLALTYDPELRRTLGDPGAPAPDLWPLFDAMAGLPLALIRGANSDLLSETTADEMQRRRPDMIRAEVPGRGHIPFLDEPEALEAITAWLAKL